MDLWPFKKDNHIKVRIFEYGDGYMAMASIDFCMNYVLRKKVEQYPIENDPNAVADEICLPIESIIEESKIDRQKVISIGISVPERIIRI
jgi:hypothetical protein